MFASVESPSHSRTIEPLPDEISNGTFHDTGADWQPRLSQVSVLQPVFILVEIVDRCLEPFPSPLVSWAGFWNAGEFLPEELEDAVYIAGEHSFFQPLCGSFQLFRAFFVE